MRALLYETKRSFINRLKKAVKKPITYLYVLLGLFYFAMIIFGWATLLKKGGIRSSIILVTILTIWTYFIFFSNFISYAKKKGIIFHPSHIHFIFTAPISPKTVLFYGAIKNFIMSFVVALVGTLAALTVFGVSIGQSLLLFLFLFVFEVIFEGSLIVFLYANERLPKRFMKSLCWGVRIFLGAMIVFLIWYFNYFGLTLESAKALIDYPAIQMMPIVGWNVAAFRLILLGPTTLSIVCTVLYLISVGIMFLIAWKMECTGNYYEEAAKFADDYAELKNRSKNGEMALRTRSEKKFKRATVEYKANGAKAIFYRQLLEYKKEKFFIFGSMSVISICAAFIVVVFVDKPEGLPPGLFLLGVIAYAVFIMTGYIGKWEKELKNPYLYMIPDKPVKKMWYATLMEHVKALIDGCILVIPIGIAWKIPVVQMIFTILVYVVLQANRLYTKVFAESIMGGTLGNTGKNIFRMMTQGGILGIGVAIAAGVGFLAGFDWVFPVVLLYSVGVTALIALLASEKFANMEQLD